MAIKINLESVKIPVEIGDLKYEIDVTDEKYEAFIQNFNEFLMKVETLNKENSEDTVLLKTLVSGIYKELLGAGSYEAIYDKMPNIGFVSATLVNIVTQLTEEMEQRITMKPVVKVVPRKIGEKK